MKKFTQNTLKYMYRYLEKYIGTYRVLAEYDKDTCDFPRDETGAIDKTFEDLYIPCRKGVIKHTYRGDDVLALCFYGRAKAGHNTLKEIKQKYPKLDLESEDFGEDFYIYFDAEDIKKVASIVKPKTSGSSIKPFSNKNLPKASYKVPGTDLARLYKITEDMDRVTKMHFIKKCNADFIESLSTKKFDAKADMKASRLNVKEYIHSKGEWENYLQFVQGKL